MDIRRFLSLFALLVAFVLSNFGYANEPQVKIPNANKSSIQKQQGQKQPKKVSPEVTKLIKQSEALKKEVIELNRELYKFEEKLLYPTETQFSVFLSINPKSAFSLDSIKLYVDNVLVATHIYEESELSALKKGGIQRLYIGSLSDGKHKLTAEFNGEGTNNSYFRRKKALKFTKENKAKYIQLKIDQNKTTKEPIFRKEEW